MFKGLKPAAQPRSLRSRAETNASGNFPADSDAVQQELRGEDAALAAQPTPTQARRGLNSADPTPFTKTRGR